jgi:hypothetical protein
MPFLSINSKAKSSSKATEQESSLSNLKKNLSEFLKEEKMNLKLIDEKKQVIKLL